MDQAQTLPTAVAMPRRVRTAVIALWVSWAISACLLPVNSRLLENGTVPVWSLVGVASLALNAFVIHLIAKGSYGARAFLLIIAIIGVPSVLFAGWFTSTPLPVTAPASGVSLILKVAAIFMLYTGEARGWFKPHRVKISGP